VTNAGGPTDPEAEPFGTPSEDEDQDQEQEGGGQTALPPKVEAWRRRSATGAILTGFALGLQQALGKEVEEPAIVMQTSGDPPRDLPVEAEVEQGRPRQSVVNIRPWLLPDRGQPASPDSESDQGEAAGPGTGPPTPDS
jgi:hypothetical protein